MTPRNQPIPTDAPPVTTADFDRELDAVADLGLDNTGGSDCSETVKNALNNGRTLVRFPEGDYRFDRQMDCTSDGIGLVGPEDGTARLFPGRSGAFNLLRGAGGYPSGLLVENITLDRTAKWDRSIGLVEGNWSDSAYIHNVDVPGTSAAGDQLLIWNLRGDNPRALIDGLWKTGPTEFTEYPQGEITIYNGPPTKGNLTYRNMDIRNTTESAMYCGKDDAGIHVVDSYFENCMHTAIRIAGKDSSVRNCDIVLDIGNGHPDNRNAVGDYVRDSGDAEPQIHRGIWLFTNVHRREGPAVIEDCDIYLARDEGHGHGDNETMDGHGRVHHKIAGVLVGSDTGGTTIRNCRIKNENPTAKAIRAQSPNSKAGGDPTVRVENCHIDCAGSNIPVEIEGRSGSSVTNSHVRYDGGRAVEVSGSVTNCQVSGGPRAVAANSVSGVGAQPNPNPLEITGGVPDEGQYEPPSGGDSGGSGGSGGGHDDGHDHGGSGGDSGGDSGHDHGGDSGGSGGHDHGGDSGGSGGHDHNRGGHDHGGSGGSGGHDHDRKKGGHDHGGSGGGHDHDRKKDDDHSHDRKKGGHDHGGSGGSGGHDHDRGGDDGHDHGDDSSGDSGSGGAREEWHFEGPRVVVLEDGTELRVPKGVTIKVRQP